MNLSVHRVLILCAAAAVFAGMTYIIKEGETEVGRWEEDDGSSRVEIIREGAKPAARETAPQEDISSAKESAGSIPVAEGTLTRQFLEEIILQKGGVVEKTAAEEAVDQAAQAAAESHVMNAAEYKEYWDWHVLGDGQNLEWLLGGLKGDPGSDEIIRMMKKDHGAARSLEMFQPMKVAPDLESIHQETLSFLRDADQALRVLETGDLKKTRMRVEEIVTRFKPLREKVETLS